MTDGAQQVKLFADFRDLFRQLADVQYILATEKPNSELREIAESERVELIGSISSYCEEIVDVIIPKLDADSRDVTLEIQSAAGGSESSLFANDLCEMYKNYCRLMGWRLKQIDFQPDISIGRGCKSG